MVCLCVQKVFNQSLIITNCFLDEHTSKLFSFFALYKIFPQKLNTQNNCCAFLAHSNLKFKFALFEGASVDLFVFCIKT